MGWHGTCFVVSVTAHWSGVSPRGISASRGSQAASEGEETFRRCVASSSYSLITRESEERMSPEQPIVDPTPAARIYRREQIIYFIFGVIELLIVIRVILRLLAANPNAGFTSLLYGITGPFIAPFEGVFPTPHSNGSVLELSSLLAVIVY